MATIAAYDPFRSPSGEVVYPESDGKPMAETDIHARCIIDVRTMLDNYFARDPDVYVSGNLLLYYEEGNPRESISPDVFIVRGAGKRLRRTYRLWDERIPPQFVLEVTSSSTRWEDQATKRGLYQVLGVQEYVQFDPTQDYLRPPLQGFRLEHGVYQPLPLLSRPGVEMALRSDVLGLELHADGERLRLFDTESGAYLRTASEEIAAREVAEAARQEAEQRAQALEAELTRLREELARRGS